MGIRAVGTLAIVSLTERHPIVFIKLRVLGLVVAFQVSVLQGTLMLSGRPGHFAPQLRG